MKHKDPIMVKPRFTPFDFSRTREYSPKKMKAKAKWWAAEVKRAMAGQPNKYDNLKVTSIEQAKALAKKLYTPLEFQDFEPQFNKEMKEKDKGLFF